MFCTQCGKEIREGLKFCPACGTAVKIKTVVQADNTQQVTEQQNTVVQPTAVQQQTVQPAPAHPMNVQPSGEPKKKKGMGAIIALIIVLIFIIIALIGVSFAEFWITGGKETIYETLGISVETEEDREEEEEEKESKKKKKKDKNSEDEDESDEKSEDETKEMKEDEEAKTKKSEEAVKEEPESEEVEEAEEAVAEAEEPEEEIAEEIVEEPEEEPSEYILENSDSQYLTKDDLKGMTKEECRLARNELYARHGRKFDDEGLQNYFNSCSWYQGTIDASDFSESMLSDIEMANRDLIVEYEKEMGYR